IVRPILEWHECGNQRTACEGHAPETATGARWRPAGQIKVGPGMEPRPIGARDECLRPRPGQLGGGRPDQPRLRSQIARNSKRLPRTPAIDEARGNWP